MNPNEEALIHFKTRFTIDCLKLQMLRGGNGKIMLTLNIRTDREMDRQSYNVKLEKILIYSSIIVS